MFNIPIAWAPSTMLGDIVGACKIAELTHRQHTTIRVLDVTEADDTRSRCQRGFGCFEELFRGRHWTRQLNLHQLDAAAPDREQPGRDTRRMLLRGGENLIVWRKVDASGHRAGALRLRRT